MNLRDRDQRNERFLKRLLARRPQDREKYEARLRQPVNEAALEGAAERGPGRRSVLETIVSEERPVLFVKNGGFDTNEVTIRGTEAADLVAKLTSAPVDFMNVLPLIGRFDVVNFPGIDFVGTGWFVDHDIVITNRHVASLIARWDGRRFAFTRGVAGRPIEASLCNAHELDDTTPDESNVFKVVEVLFIERDDGPDIAFVRVARPAGGSGPRFIALAENDPGEDVPVCVVGYPAKAPRHVIPDQALMQDLFRNRFDVKRAAPGYFLGVHDGTSEHDCTTLGGNSGSVVLDFHGRAVGLHFAGQYMESNFAVPVSVLAQYVSGKRWNQPIQIAERSGEPVKQSSGQQKTLPKQHDVAPSPADVAIQVATSATFTIPLTIRVELGVPVAGSRAVSPADAPQATGNDLSRVESAVRSYWRTKPEGVLAARVGFLDDGETIGDQPCIAVSVSPSRLPEFEARGQKEFEGIALSYYPAEVGEQIDAIPSLEAVESIAYDDDARGSDEFSFAPVNEELDITLHVGPEYSWEVLQKFLRDANGRLVSAMYEFHAAHIRKVLEERLEQGVALKLVLDNSTFSEVKDDALEFDRVDVFNDWAHRFLFERIIAPEGGHGLIANAYHIKVTVRDDDTFWLSSGNWKMSSSQPLITQTQRDEATRKDLPGNREWHVVIRNKKLADRFRAHILQDFQRSKDLGGDTLPKRLRDETFVDVPLEEAVTLERPAPRGILKPKTLKVRAKVRLLLTPDREGEVYSEAVLTLIRSARTSLLFQIPYISISPNPSVDRGYIDALIQALVDKLITLEDARVILRSGGKEFSSPQHVAWFLKSKGVDISRQLRVIEDHHTKGMIVDGRRLLLGSHNWSGPGVTLNRDASLIIEAREAAEYYAEAFEIDWERASPVKARKFVRRTTAVREAVGESPPAGFQRIRLADWLKDE